jgi:uncharacterized protein
MRMSEPMNQPVNEGTEGEDRNLAEMDEADSASHHDRQQLIQEAIDEVVAGGAGRDVATVRAQLVEALSRRGIGEQPPRWVDTVAGAAAEGRRYVEDTSSAP